MRTHNSLLSLCVAWLRHYGVISIGEVGSTMNQTTHFDNQSVTCRLSPSPALLYRLSCERRCWHGRVPVSGWPCTFFWITVCWFCSVQGLGLWDTVNWFVIAMLYLNGCLIVYVECLCLMIDVFIDTVVWIISLLRLILFDKLMDNPWILLIFMGI